MERTTVTASVSGVVSGNVNGGGGADTLDYSGRSAGIVVNLQTNSATANGGAFTNIGSLVGSTGSDTLVGANVTNLDHGAELSLPTPRNSPPIGRTVRRNAATH